MTIITTKKGFTIVELMIALALTGIILAAVYGVYIAFYKTSGSQDLMIEAQQNAKAGIAVIERDLINAGLNAGTADVFPYKTATWVTTSYSMVFRYRDPRETLDTTKAKKEVWYGLVDKNGDQVVTATGAGTCSASDEPCHLVRKICYDTDNNGVFDNSCTGNEKVVAYVDNLTFTYYDGNGGLIADTSIDGNTAAEQDNRNLIRLVKVSLTTKTSAKLPTKDDYSTVTLTTQVNLRNMGVTGTASDTTAPDEPTSVAVRDPQICGKLSVNWTKSNATDVAGYKIYYGTAAGAYTGVVSVSLSSLTESSGTYTYTIQPTNQDGTNALQYSKSDGTSTTMYYIAMKAYDNSGNLSASYSNEVSGNPTPSSSTHGSGSNDTTINPVKPAAPTAFTGANGPANYQVSLSWTGSGATDLAGYRIYRDTAAFTTYPIDASKQIACETGCANVVGKSATTFTDTSAGLIGCQVYYYAIAAVNCDGTLVTNDAGDDDTKRYISTNYAVTYGDGAESGADSPDGSDTAPPDTVAPSAPSGFGVRAGWKRVAVSLTQPPDTDLDQTCVYANQGAAYPTLDTGASKESGCYQVAAGARAYGPPSDISTDGIFTVSELAASTSKSYWHNSMLISTDTPSLLETGTYSYGAVAFDKCGNASNVAQAQDSTTLCGEDPIGKPPAPTGPLASACSSPVTITWTAVPSIAGGTNSDLAGYRIFRSANSSDWSGAALLNPPPDAPFWGTSYNDTGIADGGEYYYRITSTDCPYEKGDDTGGITPTIAQMTNHMSTGFLNSAQVGPVYTGKIDRDEKTSAVQDSHLEVLTGKDAKIGSSEPTAYDYYHNTVTLYFENTSSGTVISGKSLVITGIDQMSWNNPSACLKKITIGGSPSTAGTSQEVVWDNALVCTNPTGVIDGLIDKEIMASDRHVPITFEWTKTDGTIDNTSDMRNSNVRVKLKVENNSTTGTDSCSAYLTYSGGDALIYVPSGPTIYTPSQDKPSSLTTPYEATSGNNPSNNPSVISVAGGNNVNVTITTADGTYDGVTVAVDSVAVASPANESANVVLYYITTDQSVTQAPQYTGANYTAINMFKTAANTYSLLSGAASCATTPTATHASDRRIPAQASAKRVWYFIVVKDTEGNFDRAPEVVDTSAYYTAYTYDQGAFAVCDVTPAAPTSLTASLVTDDVTLSWTASTTYSDGGCKSASDSFNYRIYRGGAQIGADQAGAAICNAENICTYADNNLANGIYSYYVKAKNSCATEERLSSASNTAVKCVGSAGQVLSVDKTSMLANDSFTVTVNDCSLAGGATPDTVNNVTTSSSSRDTDIFSIVDNGNLGEFTQTITTTTTLPASDSLTELYTNTSDTITVTLAGATGSPKTITVSADPCNNTPSAPVLNSSVVVSGQNMTISWTGVTTNTDSTAITDLAGYKIYEKCVNGSQNCTGGTDWFVRATAGSTATSYTLSADYGNLQQRTYYFKITAYDSCSTPKESGYSNTVNE
ncbi:MAG: prepilin-type N-terminal cleavage/methylation domain-containing protein [Deltaproteobacteria bacterium]|nr:prepilin-type N-terminal cleavage/methylation domain-containing protein [Deltaproteobacteria bacterium]